MDQEIECQSVRNKAGGFDECADWVTTTVTVGRSPQAAAVNPVTNKIYVVNW